MKMQKSILPNFEISILKQFGFPKIEKSAPQNQAWNSILIKFKF